MNKDTFIDIYLLSGMPGQYNRAYKSDLNEVIQDALTNFKDFFNSEYEALMPIRQDDIDNFLNRKL